MYSYTLHYFVFWRHTVPTSAGFLAIVPEVEDCCLLACNAVESGRYLLMFLRYFLPLCSEYKMVGACFSEISVSVIRLHGATSHKTVLFLVSALRAQNIPDYGSFMVFLLCLQASSGSALK
jgi:hypothetical protein